MRSLEFLFPPHSRKILRHSNEPAAPLEHDLSRSTIWLVEVLIAVAAMLWLDPLAASVEIYTGANPHVAELHFSYPGSLQSSGTPYRPEDGYFKFRNGSSDLYRGGWMQVTVVNTNPTVPAFLPPGTGQIEYPVKVVQSFDFQINVPSEMRGKIRVDAHVINKPYFDLLGQGGTGAVSQHQFVSRQDLTAIERQGDVYRPRGDIWWVDQSIVLRLEVWVEDSIRDPIHQGRFVHEIPLRTIDPGYAQISPYLLPVAIIGDPPGNQSWSRLTFTSGTGASFAISESQASSVTTDASFGFGPINITQPTETNFRETNQGIHQHLIVNDALGISTNTNLGPGAGDVLIALCRPSFTAFRALRDLEFRYITPSESGQSAPCVVVFNMDQLRNPQPGTPPANLTPDENAAFQSLNPLLANPHAQLLAPRYFKVYNIAGSGASLSANVQARQITKTVVESVVGNSITYQSTSGSFTIPLGAIGSALGSPVPLPDLSARQSETTTTRVEYKTSRTFSHSNGILAEFHLGDSDPNKWLHVEVYYDTLFRSFVFRDAQPREGINTSIGRFESLAHLVEKLELARRWTAWKAFELEDQDNEDARSFLVVGSFGKEHAKTGEVQLVPEEPGKAILQATILPDTGNILLPTVQVNRYLIRLGEVVYRLRMKEDSSVELEEVLDWKEACSKNPTVKLLICKMGKESEK